MARWKTSGAASHRTSPAERGPRAVRHALELSQRELAEIVAAHEMTVSRWERGIAEPTAFQARVLDVLDRAAERGKSRPAAVSRGGPMQILAHLLGQAFDHPDLNMMALSAKHRQPGIVVGVDPGEMMSSVVIEVAPSVRVGSVITTDSVTRLRSRPGCRAMAVIKATEVLVAAQLDPGEDEDDV